MQAAAGLADGGRTVLLSSHKLEELERIADDVAVLVDGRIDVPRLGRLAAHVRRDTSPTGLEELLATTAEAAWR